MKSYTLMAQFSAEMDCPKEIVMWNYYDHEHLVGTHFKLYNRARVLAERDNWSLVLRSKRMPLLPFYSSGIGFQYMDGNTMRSFHKDSIGFMLETDIQFQDLPNDRSAVTVTYRINTHPVFRILEPTFRKLFKRLVLGHVGRRRSHAATPLEGSQAWIPGFQWDRVHQ